MKKRFISMLLVVVMIAAMIPVVALPTAAKPYTGYGNGYDVYVSETAPDITDGEMDAVYENSEMIVERYVYQHNGSAQGTKFKAYAVVTATGFFVYADVTDSTVSVETEAGAGAGSGDKFQLYMQVANTVDSSTQYQKYYFDFDYAHDTAAQEAAATAGVKSKSNITSGGYSIEIFVPWTFWTGISNGLSLATATVYFGIQVNNYTMDNTVREMACDNPNTGNYWGSDYTPGGGGNTGSGTTAPSKYMIKANPITTPYTPATEETKYSSFFTNETITLDGKCDDVYLAAEAITSDHIAVGTEGKTTGFTSYIVAKDNGIYIFASIFDDTLDKKTAVDNGLRIQDGDKFQLYLMLGNNTWSRWGYIDFDYVDGGRHLVTPKTITGYDNENLSAYESSYIQQETVFWEDNKGWNIEIFIDYKFCADTYSTSQHPDLAPVELLCKVNVQTVNATCTSWNESGVATNEGKTTYGTAYDVPGASDSWTDNSDLVTVDFSASQIGGGVLTYSPSITIDGEKDDAYGDDNVAFVLGKYRTDDFSYTNEGEYGKVWVTVTDTKVSVYGKFKDTTIAASSPSDALALYVYFPITRTTTYIGYGYARAGHIDTTSRWSPSAFKSTNGDGAKDIGETFARKDLGDGWYAVELAMNLPEAEKYYLAQGKTIDLGLVLQHKDCDTDGTVHSSYNCWSAYINDETYAYCAYPRYEVSKNNSFSTIPAEEKETPIKITGANVVLNESITVNYYARVPYVENVSMKFTMNDKVTYVQGVPTGKANEYKFSFEGVSPQLMGQNIKAELYVAGVKIDTQEEYSILTYCNNRFAETSNQSEKDLITALLNYGAAAQVYTGYDTENLVNADYAAEASIAPQSASVKNVANNSGDAVFTAAGVHFDNANKIYAKIASETKPTVTINGVAATVEALEAGKWIVYSDGILVTDFDAPYTIVIGSGSGAPTLTYSVNSYAYSMNVNAGVSASMKALANATYSYGLVAEAYVAN